MLALLSLLFAARVTAGVWGDMARLGRRVDPEEAMRRYLDTIVEQPLGRRQTTTAGMNVTQWNTETAQLCRAHLEALNGVASNPSGMAVCYNLPALDNSTGVFMADLRLYVIAAPTGPFTNIASTNVQVGLSYNGATVSAFNSSTLTKRADEMSWPRSELIETETQTQTPKRAAKVPTLIQSYAFVGQINKQLLAANMGTAALQKVLVPTVSLTGQTSTGAAVNTSLSSNEATFVNGVFATQLVPTKSKVEPPLQTLVVAKGEKFVVPGLKIMIFPIGLIITSTWTVLFIVTIAYGTVGRIQFRDQFRKRSARQQKGDVSRI